MNAIYYLNKAVGILFALTIAGLIGYRAWVWRNDMAKEAGRRLQKRLEKIGEESAAEFKSPPFETQFKFNADNWKNFQGGIYPGTAGQRP